MNTKRTWRDGCIKGLVVVLDEASFASGGFCGGDCGEGIDCCLWRASADGEGERRETGCIGRADSIADSAEGECSVT
jgi:hypothetical protein